MSCERVIVSSRVFTGVGDRARALAVGINGGLITAVVPADQADTLVGPATDVRDYGDVLITYGLHDAHEHVLHAALFPSALATQYVGTSEEDEIAHLVEFARTLPEPGGRDGAGDPGWVLAHGWRSALWNDPTTPTNAKLNAAFPDRPVALYSGDSHTLWLNARGLAELGIDEATEPPAGGSFDRDADGHLTGVLHEAASMAYVARLIGMLPDDALLAVYRDYIRRLNAMGITAVCDMALSLIPGADSIRPDIYRRLLDAGELTVRAHLFPTLTDDESNLEDMQAALTGPMLRAPGFKQFFDGVSSEHTAWCSEEYANPRFPGDVGRPTVPPERMRELVLAAASRGHAVRIHTIGDAAVHAAIDIFDEAYRTYGAPSQGANTMEHIEDIQPADIARLAQAHVVASVQPPHIVLNLVQPDRDLGPGRAARMWPLDGFERAGVTTAYGTDAPVVGPSSMDVLYTAVTRRTPDTHEPADGWYPEHRVSRAQALRAYTAGSAAAVGRGDELGTIAPGRWADLAVWDHDLLTCADDEIQGTRCLATYVAGEAVYEA